MWLYRSPIGDMVIQEREDGMFQLCLGSEVFGPWYDPEDAAADVAEFSSGCWDWDCLNGQVFSAPTDLDDWTELEADNG